MPASVFPADIGDARLTERRSPRLGYTATGTATTSESVWSPQTSRGSIPQRRLDANLRHTLCRCSGPKHGHFSVAAMIVGW
jgi:hypothetical protein